MNFIRIADWVICILKTGRYEKAIGIYQQGADKFPDQWILFYNLARLYSKLGKSKKSIEYLLEAKRLKLQAS